MKFFILFILLFTYSYTSEKYQTVKTSCIQQSEHSGKTLDQQKKVLINQAKREALEELYGSLIFSKTDIKNGRLVSDEIKQKAVGSVRVKGNPKFYNGENFGEICSDVKAYITKKDLEKYSPKEVKLNNFCFNDTSIATKDIKLKAKEKAYKEIITKYKPSLKNISLNQAQEFIHEFSMTNESFDFNKGSLCFDAKGSILPYELELSNVKNSNSSINSVINTDELKNGIKVTFYKKNDRKFKTPIHTTSIQDRSFYLKGVNFPRDDTKRDQVYLVKLEGYLKPTEDISSLSLNYDVYDANLFIDNKKVITRSKPFKKIKLLENNTYKFKLIIKSANAYDIALLATKGKNTNFTVLTNEEIYYK